MEELEKKIRKSINETTDATAYLNEKWENKLTEQIMAEIKAIQVQARVSPKVADTMHQISLRVYKSELVDLIGSLTYDNRNFRKEAWSMFDAERLIMAGETIKNALEKQ